MFSFSGGKNWINFIWKCSFVCVCYGYIHSLLAQTFDFTPSLKISTWIFSNSKAKYVLVLKSGQLIQVQDLITFIIFSCFTPFFVKISLEAVLWICVWKKDKCTDKKKSSDFSTNEQKLAMNTLRLEIRRQIPVMREGHWNSLSQRSENSENRGNKNPWFRKYGI